MPTRPRVLSFMSQWGGGTRSPAPSAPASPTVPTSTVPASPLPRSDSPTTYGSSETYVESPSRYNPAPPRTESAEKRHSKRSSMVIAYQPPMMEIAKDTPPELQPIFSYLNGHSNKLYQEGYFLKLHDLDSRGRPSADRVWSECFAQLVGTVLSLWDAAQLDAAGDDGEVMPTFINLTDASIKMIESLPMNGLDGQSLQNVLSISTAANNRYLLHFNSLHSLTQWTAGIRLAMFEHLSLQEAYTGSIIAGKGKHINGIRAIMERSRFPTEDWARVRFGAGTPWRRCWCVITPPDERELAKAAKIAKKRSAYEKAPPVRGDIKFYENKKVSKKTRPIATIRQAYAAYALYPQSKTLIDQSTLAKVEGTITIHSNPETTTEGFVFVMPEVHAAITGFEMLIRWLMPAFDTFALYGRPYKLIADVTDTKSLMFGMPSGRRYGHLDLIDVAGLIHTEGSQNWSEREWRKQMKLLTSKRMSAPQGTPHRMASSDQYASKSSDNLPPSQSRSSLNLPSHTNGVRFATPSTKSQPGTRQGSPTRNGAFGPPQRTNTDPNIPQMNYRQHQRAASEAPRRSQPSRFSSDQGHHDDSPDPPAPPPHQGPPSPIYDAPPPPQHGVPAVGQYQPTPNHTHMSRNAHQGSEGYASDHSQNNTPPNQESYYANGHSDGHLPPPMNSRAREPLRPVAAPPMMAHKSNAQPPRRPAQMPDLRRANSAIDPATMAQLNAANPSGAPGMGMQHNQMQNGTYQQPREDNQTYYHPYQDQAASGMRGAGIPSGMSGPSPSGMNGMNGMNGTNFVNRPPQSGYSQSNGNGGAHNLPDRRLPTIPGTPAVEHDNFDLTPQDESSHPPFDRARSSNSIYRKPVPGR